MTNVAGVDPMPYKTGKWVADSSEYRADRYYRHAEFGALLRRWADDHSDFVALDTLAKSYEACDIWVVTITDTHEGSHDTNPACFVDANVHAGEVTGVAIALCLVEYPITKADADSSVRKLLAETTLYIITAINVDATDHMLMGRACRSRSSMWPFPRRQQQNGIDRQDLDVDGLVATTRIEDPNGLSKVFSRDARLIGAPRGR